MLGKGDTATFPNGQILFVKRPLDENILYEYVSCLLFGNVTKK